MGFGHGNDQTAIREEYGAAAALKLYEKMAKEGRYKIQKQLEDDDDEDESEKNY